MSYNQVNQKKDYFSHFFRSLKMKYFQVKKRLEKLIFCSVCLFFFWWFFCFPILSIVSRPLILILWPPRRGPNPHRRNQGFRIFVCLVRLSYCVKLVLFPFMVFDSSCVVLRCVVSGTNFWFYDHLSVLFWFVTYFVFSILCDRFLARTLSEHIFNRSEAFQVK